MILPGCTAKHKSNYGLVTNLPTTEAGIIPEITEKNFAYSSEQTLGGKTELRLSLGMGNVRAHGSVPIAIGMKTRNEIGDSPKSQLS